MDCIGCNGQMITDNPEYNKKCLLCKKQAIFFCSIFDWKCSALCYDCTEIILLFQTIMPNAIYKADKILEFDETKMTALRIESLQNMGLL